MVHDFGHLALVEPHVRVAEMHERDRTNEDQQVGVVSHALRLERIIAQFITVRQIVDVGLLAPVVAVGVTGKHHVVAINKAQ